MAMLVAQSTLTMLVVGSFIPHSVPWIQWNYSGYAPVRTRSCQDWCHYQSSPFW
jgi:hypothetical protein